MKRSDIAIGIVGSGGDGVITAGELLSGAAAAEGLNCMMVKSYGPQIRGGEAACTVRIGEAPIRSQGDGIDVLGAFNWRDWERFKDEMPLRSGGAVVYDSDDPTPAEKIPVAGIKGVRVVRIPLSQIARRESGGTQAKNLVLMGALAALFNLPKEGLERGIRAKLSKKGEKVLEANLKSFRAGAEAALAAGGSNGVGLAWKPGSPKLLVGGNEAIGIGALAAGCRFFAGYPITPASEIMEFLLNELPRWGGTAVQSEDEIAAAGMVVGASFAGVPAMTATSGPGFSLMTEMMGLSTMAELPMVLVNVQRGGPATGIPTRTEQADLSHAVWGGHGDAPRIVLAATDVAECYSLTCDAFALAERYQIPVILLSDQFLGQRKEAVARDSFRIPPPLLRKGASGNGGGPFLRFHELADGVSALPSPGTPGAQYLASGIEHNERGYPASGDRVHQQMSEKRGRKLTSALREVPAPVRVGPADAQVGIVAWGSSRGPAEEALLRLGEEGVAASGFFPRTLEPFPVEEFRSFARSARRLVVAELSYGGQFWKLLGASGVLPADAVPLRRAGGRPFAASEFLDVVRDLQKGG